VTIYEFSGKSTRVVYREVELVIRRRHFHLAGEVTDPNIMIGIFRDMVQECSVRENFLAFYMDTKHRIVGVERQAIGGQGSVEVSTSEMFTSACLLAATTFAVAHNHPSGNPSPSNADVELTKRLDSGGALLGIPLLDHIIIGESEFYSFHHRQVAPINLPQKKLMAAEK